MKVIRSMVAVAIASAFALTACGEDSPDSASAPMSTEAESSSTSVEPGSPMDSAPVPEVERVSGSRITTFPVSFDDMVMYGDYRRGDGGEQAWALPETIELAKDEQTLPPGTVLVLEIYDNDEVTDYFVMEKGEDWGLDYEEDVRTGDWHFQQFSADREIVEGGSAPASCMSCHGGQADEDFMFTTDRLRAYMP